jgi:hypothetical protein
MEPNFRIDSAYVNDGCSANAESLLPILIRIGKHTLARLIASSHQSLGSSAAMKRRDLLLFAGAMEPRADTSPTAFFRTRTQVKLIMPQWRVLSSAGGQIFGDGASDNRIRRSRWR